MSHPTRPRPEDLRTANEAEIPQNCPDCDGILLHHEKRGETACDECGLVVQTDEIDRGPEWRAFNPKDKQQKSRVGAPTTVTRHDKGLSTTIGRQNRDANGNILPGEQRLKMRRLRTWDERFRTRNSKERNLKHALGEIERMASALGLPENVQETASVMYRRALEDNLVTGRSIEGVATACIYAGGRQAGIPRSLEEVAAVSRIGMGEFQRTYRYLVRELELAIEPADPEQYVPRFISELGLSEDTERYAMELIDLGKSRGLHTGRSPVSIAAAAIYAGAVLSREGITQSAVATVSSKSKLTIRNRYQELLEAYEDDD